MELHTLTLSDVSTIAGLAALGGSAAWAVWTWRHARREKAKHQIELARAEAKAEGHAMGAILGELRQWREAMGKEVNYNQIWRHDTMVPFIQETGVALAKVSTEVSGLGGRIARIEGAMNGWLTGATANEFSRMRE